MRAQWGVDMKVQEVVEPGGGTQQIAIMKLGFAMTLCTHPATLQLCVWCSQNLARSAPRTAI